METSKIYLLEIIKVKDIKTGKEYVWIYEGKDMFSKCFGDHEMVKGKDLEEKLYKTLLIENEDGSMIYSPRFEMTGITKDGFNKKIGLANEYPTSEHFNEIEVYDSSVLFTA